MSDPVKFPLWPDAAEASPSAPSGQSAFLTIYPAPHASASAPAPVIIICPGGGYCTLADHEGTAIVQWALSLGFAAALLHYRHSPHHRHPAPLADADRAIRTVRAEAGASHIDPNHVAIIGFSAGGHLVSTISTHFSAGDPHSSDPLARHSSRPDAAILCYPVIALTGELAERGSAKNLLGERVTGPLAEALSTHTKVTPQTPPTFLFHTVEDAPVPMENSLLYAAALRKNGVPFELHLYEKGQHGVGLAKEDPVLQTWPDLCVRWLRSHGFVAP
jgi:acetyl esterase/lipase